jgi:hypothetical protein
MFHGELLRRSFESHLLALRLPRMLRFFFNRVRASAARGLRRRLSAFLAAAEDAYVRPLRETQRPVFLLSLAICPRDEFSPLLTLTV